MEIVDQMQSGFPDGKKSQHSDTISFEEWAESWYNRECSGDWISEIHRKAKYSLNRREERDDEFKERMAQIRKGETPIESPSVYTKDEFETKVEKLKETAIRGLYKKVIVRLNVLLKLNIADDVKYNLNNIAIDDEMYQKMLEFLYDDKKLFRTLNPKEVELFELLLTVIDEDKNVLRSLKNDKWECIDLSDREKIYAVLDYLACDLGWNEYDFVKLGLISSESIQHNTFRIVGRPLSIYYDESSLIKRKFCDYDIRLLHPKEYRLSCSLDHIYTIIEAIESCASKQEYEEILGRTISRVDKIWKNLEKGYAGRIESAKKSVDKLFGEE